MGELCNGDKCLHKDTLIVLCYALFCVCFGLIVASLVGVLDKRRNKKKKFSAGVEATETTDGKKALSRQTSELEEVYRTLDKLETVGKFTGKKEDILDSPSTVRRGSSASAIARRGSSASNRMRQEMKAKQATSPLAV